MPASVCIVLFAAAAASQPSAIGAEGNSDEILVTGERVSRSVRDTPTSVAVLTADDLDGLAAPDRLEQILEALPNVQVGNGGQGPAIRGQDSTGVLQDLPAFLGGTRPRVTLQVDGRAVAYNEFVFGVSPVWDVAQIEVFRSPQTTTQGRNSIAGAIIVTTSEPTFGWETKWRALHGSASTSQASGVVSGPLAERQIAFRMSADFRRSRPSSAIEDTMRGADPNQDRHATFRFKLLVEPRAMSGTRVTATYAHTESRAPQVERIKEPFWQRRDPDATYGIWGTNVDSLTARLEQRVSQKVRLTATLSRGTVDNQRYAPPGLGEARNKANDTSVEAVVHWALNSSAKAHVGVHALRTRLNQRIDLNAQGLGMGIFDDRQSSFGAFGEVAWSPFKRVTVTAGLRHQKDEQQRAGRLDANRGSIPLYYNRTFEGWLPKLSASYAVSAQLTAGLLIQRAVNPGGVTLVTATGEHDEFDQERLWNFEAYLRAKSTNGALTFSSNVFYNRIQDAQRARQEVRETPAGKVTITRLGNIPKAHTYGMEADARWRASTRLKLRAGLGLLRTRIDETLVGSDPLNGKQFARAPKLSATIGFEWEPLSRLRLNLQGRYNSGYYSDDQNSPTRKIEAGFIADSRVDYRTKNGALFAYARNVFDRLQLTYLYNDPAYGTAADPREIGVGIEARF